MHRLVDNGKANFDKALDFVKTDIGSLRTGRVAPSLVEKVPVESYGTVSDLMHLASITAPEPQTIIIKPWDPGVIKDIEKALGKADIRVSPVVDGQVIRLNFPSLTEETRKELAKVLHKKLEEGRIALRGVREKIREEIMSAEKDKTISEDEKFQALKELDELTKDYNDKIKVLGDKKETEIMTI